MIVFASVGMAFCFRLAMGILIALSYYVEGQELACMPLTIIDMY